MRNTHAKTAPVEPNGSPIAISQGTNTPSPKQLGVGWANQRINIYPKEKGLMADYFVEHDFLVPDRSPGERIRVATIVVNPGTTQPYVIRRALDWIRRTNHRQGQFDITWYTSGSLIPTIMTEFRGDNSAFIQSTQLFVFPGRLELQIDSVCSPETVSFVTAYDRAFTYAFLSANSFDLNKGSVYFHFSSEIELQRAIALKEARHKFLFLDPSKFDTINEGGCAYNLTDLLRSSHSVTLYTVSSSLAKDEWICQSFDDLSQRLLSVQPDDPQPDAYHPDFKSLRLRIVGRDSRPTETRNHVGPLAEEPTSGRK